MKATAPRRRRLRGLHINRMIPNVLTLLALSAGLSALRFALQDKWELALLSLVAAGILDGLDGRIARILKGATRFGAELDSLSDFLCFGVAPALTLYFWSLDDANRLGWSLVLVYCICCALRLARFNADIDAEDSAPHHIERIFFVGVPSPAGAGLVLLPLVLWVQFEADFLRHPAFVAVFVFVSAALLVSRIRTFTFKKIRIRPNLVLPSMLAVGLYLAMLLSVPWITLAVTMTAYVASIPISHRAYRLRMALEADGSRDEASEDLGETTAPPDSEPETTADHRMP